MDYIASMSLTRMLLAACLVVVFNHAIADDSPAAPLTTEDSVTDRYVAKARELVLQAMGFMGINYKYGGDTPETGFDCSGLVAYVYREGAGLALPRNTFDLSRLGQPIERAALRPGDLVFYNTQGREYSHVGIYLGEDRFIHAPSSGGEVRVESLRADYWVRRYNGARRVIALH